jgi:hypothetical protein
MKMKELLEQVEEARCAADAGLAAVVEGRVADAKGWCEVALACLDDLHEKLSVEGDEVGVLRVG